MSLMAKTSNGLILYELNEVPRRLLDKYINEMPNSTLAQICKESNIINTITKDEGELHPWTTWPTLHRGVNNFTHGIQFINQDLSNASKWPPIWECLSEKGVSIGVFGSLQSYPPYVTKNTKFYLPDTFSPSYDAFPKNLELFQKLNLNLAGRNKAIATKFKLSDLIDFFSLLKNRLFNLKSLKDVLKHLIKEIINPKYKTRRPFMQAILGFDIYIKYLRKEKPLFSTYFTNHVAGAMHRYWKFTFPGDFLTTADKLDDFHSNTIYTALDIADKQLNRLVDFSNTNNYDIWIISSMGQGPVDRGNYFPEIFIDDISKIIESVGLCSSNYKLLPAMYPDLCIECFDQKSYDALITNIINIKDKSGKSIFMPRYRQGLKVNISIKNSKITSLEKVLVIGENVINLDSLNIKLISRDQGTGYHIPQGIFIPYGKRSLKMLEGKSFDFLDTTNFRSFILEFFDF